MSKANSQRLDPHLLLGVRCREAGLVLRVRHDHVHAIFVDIDVRNVRPAYLVQCEQTVPVGLHWLNQTVCCHKDGSREVGPFKLLQLPRATPVAHKVLSAKYIGVTISFSYQLFLYSLII